MRKIKKVDWIQKMQDFIAPYKWPAHTTSDMWLQHFYYQNLINNLEN